MSDEQPKLPVKIGSIALRGEAYDLAANGRALLAREGQDVYGRPSAKEIRLEDLLVGASDLSIGICQSLLDQLASAMKERDAALARLRQNADEPGA